MKPILVNLSSVDPAKHRASRIAVAVGVLLALGISACNARFGYHYDQRGDVCLEKIQRLSERRKAILAAEEARKTEMKDKDVASTKAHVQFVNQVILKDVFPWTRVLGAFETALPTEVYFDAFEPTDGFGVVALRGHARSMSEVSAYLKDKESEEIFQKIDLLKIDVDSESTAAINRLPVRFEIESLLDFKALLPEAAYGRLWRLAAKPEKES